MAESVLEIAKDLTLALVESGSLSADDMQDTLQQTFLTLAAIKVQEEMGLGAVRTQEPTDWRQSISRQAITCMECGQTFKQLSVRHLREHDLDGRTYRAKHGIPRTQPLVARETLAKQRKVAAKIKPWEKSPTYRQAQKKKAAAAKKAGKKKGTRRR